MDKLPALDQETQGSVRKILDLSQGLSVHPAVPWEAKIQTHKFSEQRNFPVILIQSISVDTEVNIFLDYQQNAAPYSFTSLFTHINNTQDLVKIWNNCS